MSEFLWLKKIVPLHGAYHPPQKARVTMTVQEVKLAHRVAIPGGDALQQFALPVFARALSAHYSVVVSDYLNMLDAYPEWSFESC